MLLPLFILLWFVIAPAAVAQERRVALVVGVGGYRNVPALTNPPNDARDIAAALGRLGFETETLIDPDRLALEAGARRLGQRARGADAALFFYAGHALEAGGRNWLVPAPADIRSDRDLRFETLDLDGVLEQLEGAARLSILILDACRDNPFRRRLQTTSRTVGTAPGLGQVNPAVGTLLAFATAPGTVADDGRGRNSPFTTALLRRIETPGIEVRQLMAEVRREVREATQGRQVPWENSALEGSFYFRAAPPPPTPVVAAVPPAAAAAPAAETVFWESMRASRSAADFRAYLARFPDGVFASLARNRLEELEGRRPSPATRQPDPNVVLDPATPEGREALLQRALALVQPVSQGRLDTQVQSLRGYRDSQQHRAFAIAPGRQNTFRVASAPSAAIAEELVLERCQLRNGEPCILFALNDTIRAPPPGAEWPRREMERLRYEGAYRPDRIPALTPERRREADIAAYGRAREPKAMAIHPLGRVFIVTGARNPFAAETEALRQCNEDPVRAGSGGPCFLYAAGNRVVLTGRHAEPLAPDPAPPAGPSVQQATASVPAPAPAPTPPPAPTPAAQTAPLAPAQPDPRAALHAEMLAAVPFLSRPLAETGLRDYLADRTNRAFAIAPSSGGYWRVGGLGSAALAEERALEACQIRYGVACILFAVNDEIRRPAPGAEWPRRDMPRVAGSETFDVQRIPVLSATTRAHPLATGYAAAPEPKALAIHPWGRFFVSTGASSQEVAEAAALAACNGDADRNGRDGPCLLYAVGNRVVLAARRTQATPTPVAATPSTAEGRAALATAMVASIPFLPRAAAETAIATYLSDRPHRGLAVAPERTSYWRATGMPTVAAAEQQALEGCQLRYGVPCLLFAVDDEIRRPAPGADWARRDMPRLGETDATYDPERIPLVPETRRRQPHIANYSTAPEPKAIALHPWGRIFVVTGAASQEAAESAALSACNNDGDRAGADGPCFLYASGNRVVLAERRGTARAVTAAAPVAAAAAPVDPIRRIAAAAALVDPVLRDRIPAFYTPAPREHHALALHLPSRRYFRWSSAPSAEVAEQLALEGCQQAYGSPCILLAVGTELRAPDPAAAPARDMPRLRYAGPYSAGQVPFQLPNLPRDVERYAGLPEPKAMAIHVNGRVRVVSGAASQTVADAQALTACNEPNPPIPCVLYARGNRVVLGQRLTEAPAP